MLGNIGRQRRLAHRRTRRQNHQITRAQAGGPVVEILEAGFQASDLATHVLHVEDATVNVVQHRGHVEIVGLGPGTALADGKDFLLRDVDQL